MRSDIERLRDIQDAIALIDRYTTRGKESFFADELVQAWVLFYLQTIGEAARAMSEETRERYSQVS